MSSTTTAAFFIEPAVSDAAAAAAAPVPPVSTPVVFTGSREWTDERTVCDVLSSWLSPPERYTIVHGGCATGLDSIVDRVARARGYNVIAVPVTRAEWARHGRAAGPMRNERMLADWKPAAVFAFVVPDARGQWTPGTRDCYQRAIERDIPVVVKSDSRRQLPPQQQ